MAVVSLEEMKRYLRVDFDDDDDTINWFIDAAVRLCLDVIRSDNEEDLSADPNGKIAVMYAAAYLFEHREEADHHALTLTLRSLLFGSREASDLWP